MPTSSRCSSGTPTRPPCPERGTIAEKLMPVSISAVGLRLRARPRDPITTVLRQVEELGSSGVSPSSPSRSVIVHCEKSTIVPLSRWILTLSFVFMPLLLPFYLIPSPQASACKALHVIPWRFTTLSSNRKLTPAVRGTSRSRIWPIMLTRNPKRRQTCSQTHPRRILL